MIAFAYKMEKQTQWNNSKSIIPLFALQNYFVNNFLVESIPSFSEQLCLSIFGQEKYKSQYSAYILVWKKEIRHPPSEGEGVGGITMWDHENQNARGEGEGVCGWFSPWAQRGIKSLALHGGGEPQRTLFLRFYLRPHTHTHSHTQTKREREIKTERYREKEANSYMQCEISEGVSQITLERR